MTNNAITIPRKDFADVPPTMFLRVRDPSKESGMGRLLHDLTPLFVYANMGSDWVRFEMPREIANRMGWDGMRCACCAERGEEQTGKAAETVEAYHIDTAWSEVGPWLIEHGYRKAVV